MPHDLLKESILGLRPRKGNNRNTKARAYPSSKKEMTDVANGRDSLLIRVKQQIADSRAFTGNYQEYVSPHCKKSLQPFRSKNLK